MAPASEPPRVLPGHPPAQRLLCAEQYTMTWPNGHDHGFITGGLVNFRHDTPLAGTPCLGCGQKIRAAPARLITFMDFTRPTAESGALNATTFLIHDAHWPADMISLAWNAHARLCRRCRRAVRRARP